MTSPGGSAAPIALPAITRVAILVATEVDEPATPSAQPSGVELDFSLPSRQPLVAVIENLRREVDKELQRRRLPTLRQQITYALCGADGRALDTSKTLDGSGVVDGDALWLLPVEATERFSRVIERVSTGVARAAAEQFRTVDPTVARRMGAALTAFLAGWMELILAKLWWDSGSEIPAAVSAVIAATLVGAAWVASGSPLPQRRGAADSLAWTALLCAVSGAGMAPPGHPGGWHAAAAAGAAVIGALLLGVITGRFPAAVAFCVTAGAAVFAAGVASAGAHVGAQRIAVALLTVVVIVVTYAANAGGLVSGAPMPAFPSMRSRGTFERAAGAPRNTVSPVPVGDFVTGDQLAQWARRGTLTATGMIVAACIGLVGSCWWVVAPGAAGDWRFAVFAVGICVVVVLRSQTLIDRVQSVSLTSAGVIGIAVVIGHYAAAPAPARATTSLLCAGLVATLAVAVLLAGLWLPTATLKAPLRRAVMGVELALTLVLTVPWMLWLMNAFTALRHMRH
ncbi:type VII secretion integral membrane protein EccD [Mycobacterium attenuatum]|uniref:type VII secretion integral membrane protein EccD n=1 Tax=Mycobacterium attenuatum TaxID=2341086 RepID=UPI000F014AF9|nr:type VII secretion integral membrane protein EccD [Mycobacterium attenuatum]VBA62473.1 ESX-5 secretion system protein EccD5 [Mycobacterium attenuatum]